MDHRDLWCQTSFDTADWKRLKAHTKQIDADEKEALDDRRKEYETDVKAWFVAGTKSLKCLPSTDQKMLEYLMEYSQRFRDKDIDQYQTIGNFFLKINRKIPRKSKNCLGLGSICIL